MDQSGLKLFPTARTLAIKVDLVNLNYWERGLQIHTQIVGVQLTYIGSALGKVDLIMREIYRLRM